MLMQESLLLRSYQQQVFPNVGIPAIVALAVDFPAVFGVPTVVGFPAVACVAVELKFLLCLMILLLLFPCSCCCPALAFALLLLLPCFCCCPALAVAQLL
jgi:hypothetical protein